MKQLTLTLLFLVLNTVLFAQNDTLEMADTFRRNGKIYVVVAVILAIFTGIILYLVRLDGKISKLEKTTHS